MATISKLGSVAPSTLPAEQPAEETPEAASAGTEAPNDTFENEAMRGANLMSRALKLSEQAEDVGEVGDAINETSEVVEEGAGHAKGIAKLVKEGSIKEAAKELLKPAEEAEEESSKLTKGLGAVAGGLGVVTLPGKVVTASEDIRAAFKKPTRQHISKALDSASDATYTAAVVTDKVVKPVAQKVIKAATQASTGVAEKAVAKATESAAAHTTTVVAEKAATKVVETGAAKATAHVAAEVVEHVGVEAGEKVALKAGGELLGKLTPGLNIVMAASDSAHFASVAMDKKAPTGKKIAAGLTALGSWISCSDVPVLGWAGAALSVGASVYESTHYH